MSTDNRKRTTIKRIPPGSDEDTIVEDTSEQPDARGPRRDITRNDDERQPDALGPMGNRDDSDVEGVHEGGRGGRDSVESV